MTIKQLENRISEISWEANLAEQAHSHSPEEMDEEFYTSIEDLNYQLEILKQTKWALDNDCLGDEVQECDQCGEKTCEKLARVWADTLVVCENC
jgi:hypothetical protein